MISWRAQRQLIVFLIIFIGAALAAGYFVWRMVPASTCFDNKKNQGELEVDCGGPCGPCELKHPQAIGKFWARAIPIGGNRYDLAAEIKNPNEVLSSRRVQYEFTLADEFGVIAKRAGETFIYPQERTHVVEAGVEAGRAPGRVEFKIVGVEWQYREPGSPNLVAERRDYRVVSEGGLKKTVLETQISNRSPRDLKEVEVVFLLFDEDNNLFAANRVSAGFLSSGAQKKVKSIWPVEFSASPSNILIEVRADPVFLEK